MGDYDEKNWRGLFRQLFHYVWDHFKYCPKDQKFIEMQIKPASPAGFFVNSPYIPDNQTATAKAGYGNAHLDLQCENGR